MKNQVNQKCFKANWKISAFFKWCFFIISLLLIFMCAIDDCWNGRLMLAIICAFASLKFRR